MRWHVYEHSDSPTSAKCLHGDSASQTSATVKELSELDLVRRLKFWGGGGGGDESDN